MPQSRLEPLPPAVEARCLNHWASKEVPVTRNLLRPSWPHIIPYLSKVDRPLWAPNSQSLAWIRAEGSEGSFRPGWGPHLLCLPAAMPPSTRLYKAGRTFPPPVRHPITNPSPHNQSISKCLRCVVLICSVMSNSWRPHGL